MEKLRNKGNVIYCALFIYLIATSFINQDVYAFTVRYASLIIFLVLGVMSLPYLMEDVKNKDADLIMAFFVVVLSAVFVVMTHSGYGAVLIPSDLALICYMSKHIRLGRRDIVVLSFAGASPVILWYSHVRWSYNFNMAGFAFMLMAFFGMILIEEVFRQEIADGRNSGDKEAGSILGLHKIIMTHRGFIEWMIFLTAFILSMLYHSRTAMFGMIMFLIVYLIFRIMSTRRRMHDINICKSRIGKGKLLYRLIFLLASVGAVIFTFVYIKLANRFGEVTVLYKDIFSGRQAIWKELWGAFLASPLTGIGSAYEIKSFEIFEVHNGLFDILTVHGIIVFGLIIVMLWRMFERAYSHSADGTNGLHNVNKSYRIKNIAISAAFAMMFTSYFENFFTVPPYIVIFMSFILIAAV